VQPGAKSWFFMKKPQEKRFSEPVTVFHGRRLPEQAKPAGYAALMDAYGLSVPLPLILSAIGKRHKIVALLLRMLRQNNGRLSKRAPA